MKKYKYNTAEPLSWNQFEGLISDLDYDINKTVGRNKKRYLARYQTYIGLGAYWGLRAGDQLKLTWADILDQDVVQVEEGKTINTRHRRKVRMITVSPAVQKFIRDRYEIIKPARLDQPIVPNKKGEPISIQFLNRKLEEIFDTYRIRLKYVSSHTLRKTFGRAVYENNGKSEDALIILSELFNHNSVKVTRAYLGITTEVIKDVYLNVGRVA